MTDQDFDTSREYDLAELELDEEEEIELEETDPEAFYLALRYALDRLKEYGPYPYDHGREEDPDGLLDAAGGG